MSPELSQSLLITAIGMGLVVASLLLLWGLMLLLVRATRERLPQAAPPVEEARPLPPAQMMEKKRQAAVAAVAVALARTRRPVRRPQPAGGGSPSPWQAAHRQAGSRGRRTVE